VDGPLKKKFMERTTSVIIPESKTFLQATQVPPPPPKALVPPPSPIYASDNAKMASPEQIKILAPIIQQFQSATPWGRSPGLYANMSTKANAVPALGGIDARVVPNFSRALGSIATPTRKAGIDLNTGKTYGLKTPGGLMPTLLAVAAFFLFKK
jgi:hypothetical protein